MFPNGISALVNLALSLILMHFSVASYFRQRKYKLGFGIFGLIWLSLATLGIFYTTYFGLLKSNMAAGNIIIMLVLAIGYLIASLEYDRVGLVEELNISNLSYSIRLIKALRRKSSSAT